MQLGLIITARCNASCTHCSTSCGPERVESLTRNEVTELMDQAARLNNDPELYFCISGGEPFLDFDLLLHIVSHGASLGAVISCQSNGYWAANDHQAHERLSRLKAAGLDVLGLSISRFHDDFVRRSRVQRALAIARDIGLTTVLKCAVDQDGKSAELKAWAQTSGADEVEIFSVHPYLRKGMESLHTGLSMSKGLPDGPCPAALMTVRENGRAYTCCMPGAFNEFLELGQVRSVPLEDLYERFDMQGRQQVLRRFGPIYFARAAVERGCADRLRDSYVDVCDLCSHIGSDSSLSVIAGEAAIQFEREQLSNVFADLMNEHR